MYFITLALFALVARSLATPTRSVLSYESNGINNTNSNTMTAPRTSTHVASSPQVTPNVAASKIIGGRTTLAPVPDQCTDSFIPYQTMFWVNSSQMNLEDAISPSWWAPISPSNWTFSTNTSGIWFSKPSWIVDGKNPALDLKPRTAANSFTLTMDQSDNGGHTLLWFVYKSNDSIPDVKFWNSTKNSHLPNLDVVFELTISGKFPCAHPTGNNTCASNKIELTTDAWTSNGVDKFFEKWYDRRSSGFKADGGMMQAFGKDFKIGNDHTCTIDNSCQLVSSCDDLPNHGVDGNSAQIYLIWQALQNISDMFNRMYNNLNIAEGDTMTKIAQIALEFYTPIKAATPPPNPLLMDSGILGSLSALGGLIPGVGSGISAAFGFASGLTGAINSQKAAAPPPPDPQFAESDAQLGVVFGKYANQMRTQLQKIHSSIFTAGENVTSLLSEGAYVDRTALNVDCSDCIPKAQAWLEQLLTLKMINYMWLRQNVFVTYMPYGTVIQLDTLEQTEFTGRDCHDNFLSRDDEKHLVACMPKGMGRLTYYNPALASTTEPDPDGSVKLNGMPPGADKEQSYNSTEAISVGFKSTSAVISSVAGFFEGGLGYDAITSLTSLILSGGNQGTVSWGSGSTQIGHDAGYYLQQLWQVNATTAGMFTLPVCQIRDLNYWPTFYGQDNRRAYNDYCICWNDLNPDFKDHVTGDFRKFVTTWRQGECGKGHGTEPAIGGSDVGLAPRGTRNPDYKPLPWP